MNRFEKYCKTPIECNLPAEYWYNHLINIITNETLEYHLIYQECFKGKNKVYGVFKVKKITGIDGIMDELIHQYLYILPAKQYLKILSIKPMYGDEIIINQKSKGIHKYMQHEAVKF